MRVNNKWAKVSTLLSGMIFVMMSYITLGIGSKTPPIGMNGIITRAIWSLIGIDIIVKIFLDKHHK